MYSTGCADRRLTELTELDFDAAARDVIDWFRADVPAQVERTHRHTNGFIKFLRILWARPNMQIRLHHWPIDADGDWSSIHNHRADFLSIVLVGGLHERLYRFVGDAQRSGVTAPDHRLFDYRPVDWERGAGERVMPSRRVRLALEAERSHEPGDVRLLTSHRFHQVLASPMTTTLVIRGPIMRSHSQIAVPEGDHPKLASTLEPLGPEQSARALRRVREKFDGPIPPDEPTSETGRPEPGRGSVPLRQRSRVGSHVARLWRGVRSPRASVPTGRSPQDW